MYTLLHPSSGAMGAARGSLRAPRAARSPTARRIAQSFSSMQRIPRSTRPNASSTDESHSPCVDLGQALLVHCDVDLGSTRSSGTSLVVGSPSSYLVLTLLAAGLFFASADSCFASVASAADSSTHESVNTVYTLAENEDFWANVLRYISYFFSVLLGTAYVAFKPVVALLKRPTTAIFVIAAAAGLYYFVSTTVKAMIGVDEFAYEPSSIVTPYVN